MQQGTSYEFVWYCTRVNVSNQRVVYYYVKFDQDTSDYALRT
jgi:hypothetical protein